jgi:hypothetical protein
VSGTHAPRRRWPAALLALALAAGLTSLGLQLPAALDLAERNAAVDAARAELDADRASTAGLQADIQAAAKAMAGQHDRNAATSNGIKKLRAEVSELEQRVEDLGG